MNRREFVKSSAIVLAGATALSRLPLRGLARPIEQHLVIDWSRGTNFHVQCNRDGPTVVHFVNGQDGYWHRLWIRGGAPFSFPGVSWFGSLPTVSPSQSLVLVVCPFAGKYIGNWAAWLDATRIGLNAA